MQPPKGFSPVYEDYLAVGTNGRIIAGPFKNYDEAKREAAKAGGYVRFTMEAAECGCAHTHPPEVPSAPCPSTATEASEAVPVVYEAGEAPAVTEEAAEGCLPWVKVERDPERYNSCLARARALGPVQTPEAVYNLLSPTFEKEDQEVFVVVLLDVRFQVRGVAEVARGQRSRVGVGVEDIMRIVLVSGAERFAVAHNHPSGRGRPSEADRQLTQAIEMATKPYPTVTFVDHVVCGMGEYYSIRENKLHKAPSAPRAKRARKGKS